jgi:hypothetical protein
VKKKKRKEVRGDQHSKSCESQIFKCRSIVKRYETWNVFIFKIPKEKDMFCESYELLKTLCQIWFFGHITFI